MQKKQLATLAIVLVVVLGGYLAYENFIKTSAEENWPERTISNFVFSSAGGGTDQWNRIMCALMEKSLGQRVTVANMPGGNGGTAAAHAWNSDHDGYTWLGCSETITTHPATGSSKQMAKDWQFWVMAGSPGILCVSADSPYRTYGDLVKAEEDGAKKIKIGNSGMGKLWHLKAFIAANVGKINFEHVPYQGSRPAIIACLSNEIDAVSASVGEITDFIVSGKLRPLIMTENEPFELDGFGKVPSAAEFFPDVKKYYPLNQWLGFAMPIDVPQAVKDKTTKAFAAAIGTQDAANFAKEQKATIYNLTGQAANAMVMRQEQVMSWLLFDLGLAKIDPKTVGIQRP
ncbi:MAG: tripartite tricarboxylate transporter substrate binding protein [Planctomycetota bacterium]|jgi:tripartite-type tricarboxylate transporter receptor subunit TctC|nr:tripartite tricarboxylate transporter substrate binding protein [Planctomycetota bacterium]